MRAPPENAKADLGKGRLAEDIKAVRAFDNQDNNVPGLSPQLRWNRANPEKMRAHRAVRAALERGEIERGPCFICDDPNSEAHHRFYEHPLSVSWLCRKHHRRLHTVWRKCGVQL